MKNKKSILTIAFVALLLIAAVAANIALNSGDDAETESQAAGDGAGGEEVTLSIEALSEQEPENYFDAFRVERESVRALEVQYLDEIIAASASDEETLADAQAQKLSIVENMEREFIIESMIKAKGYADAAVTFHGSTVNVVVECAALQSEDAAKILDIVMRETGCKASDVKIVSNSQ